MNNLDTFYNSSNFYQSDDGLQLHYRDIGIDNGKFVILCLPGLTRNSRDFDEFASRLAENNRVICLDLRGRALSEYDENWKNYHPLTYAKDVWTLLDKLAIEKVAIMGTSLGGLISMVMSFQNNDRIAGVILNDIGPEINAKGLERIKKYAGLLPPVETWKEAGEQTKQVYGPWLKGLDDSIWIKLAKRAYKDNAQHKPVLDMDSNISTAIKKMGPQKGDPWQLFDSLTNTETLVLRGELSDILTAEILTKMHDRNPKLVSMIIPDRGHVPLLDEEASISAIDKFLQRIRS
ncbi:MAG: alpha/beta hydrolase [Alcanivoracaceae bacterium]|nr:alpha/beta hydrolase [Alcanivoracaceae bacterium]